MSDVRVTYSGLTNFVLSMVGIITGLIFILIITRTVSPQEFGTWNLISNLIFYVIIVEPIISFWATRETARGGKTGKTAILSSGVFSLGAIFVYIILADFMGFQTDANAQVLIFGAILIPATFLNYTLTGINLGWKPHAIGYSRIVFGVTEIIAALIFVYYLDWGVSGIIICATLGYVFSITILSIYAREKITNPIKRKFLKVWLKRFWLPLYPEIGSLLKTLDVLIFTIITGSVIGLAFWTAATTISTVVGNSRTISEAMYAKLLQGDRSGILQENLIHMFYFAFPLMAISIIFAKPGLFALNPIYETAALIVILLTFRVFLFTLSIIFQNFIRGIENVDTYEKSTLRDFIKSKLFSIPTVVLIQAAIHVTALTIGLLLLGDRPMMDLLTYWASVELVVQIPFTIYFFIILKRNISFNLDLKSLFKYLLSAIGIFGLVYILLEEYLVYKAEIVEFLPNILLFLGIGAGSYLILTYFIDDRIKRLFHAIIHEISNR